MRKLLLPGALGALGILVILFCAIPQAGSATKADAVKALTPAQVSASVSSQLAEGKELFDQTCSTCHSINAGGSALAPNLRGVGSATVDLWVSSGWMPLAQPTAEPIKKPALFSRTQTVAIARYIESLAPGRGVQIPTVSLKDASVSEGFDLFSLNCAPCHTITGAGDALSNGLSAPGIHGITTEEVEEAVMTGPGNMPRFTPGALNKQQVASVVDYVTHYIEHPTNPGGVGLGGVGPVAEGFIGLFVGVGACMLIGLWIGDRSEREEEGEHENEHEGAHV